MNKSKEHILKTSLSLFLQKSYKEVTMSEIVEKTGLSKGAFYHHFKSKEELFREILDLFIAYGELPYQKFKAETFKEFYTEYAEYLDQSMQELTNMAAGNNNRPVNFFLIMFDAASKFPDFLKKELAVHKRDLNEWAKRISAARKAGEISSESSDESLASLFLYCNDGVFLRFVNSETNDSFKKLLTDAYNNIYENIKS